MTNIESSMKEILKRNLIADFVESISLMVCFFPLIIFSFSKANIIYTLAFLIIFTLFFYFLTIRPIKIICFESDRIIINYIFKSKNKYDFIKYEYIKCITYSSTPSGFSSITICYFDNNQTKKFIMNGRGINKKSKANFIAFFETKNKYIKLTGF